MRYPWAPGNLVLALLLCSVALLHGMPSALAQNTTTNLHQPPSPNHTVPNDTVWLMHDPESHAQRQFISHLQQAANPDFTLRLTTLKQPPDQIQPQHPIVTLGPTAFQFALSHFPGQPILAVYIASNEFHVTRVQHPHADAQQPIGAVFADPDYRTQLKLISELLGKQTEVATLLSGEQHYYVQWSQQQTTLPLQPEVVLSPNGEALNKSLSRVRRYQVLLALPDHQIFNPNSLKNILLTTYRYNQVVVGYSPGMVNAGTLATTYSDLSQQASDTLRVIQYHQREGQWPQPAHARPNQIHINQAVARSLAIPIPDMHQLKQAVLPDQVVARAADNNNRRSQNESAP